MNNWVTLPHEKATAHPAYGIKGTASFLRSISLVLPVIGFFMAISALPTLITARGRLAPVDYFMVFFPSIIFLLWSGLNDRLLGKHNPAFIRSFLAFLAIGPIISIAVMLIWSINTGASGNDDAMSIGLLSIIFAWGIWAAIWVPYILLSKRINVTLLCRVRLNDPFLHANGEQGS